MSTAIIYYSEHHGNTKKLLDAIAAADPEVELINVTKETKDLSGYERIGIASGIYFSNFAKQLLVYAGEHLPEEKPVFFIYTHGAPKGDFLKGIRAITSESAAGSLASTAARALIPSDRLNWWEVSPKDIRRRKKWMAQWRFIRDCLRDKTI